MGKWNAVDIVRSDNLYLVINADTVFQSNDDATFGSQIGFWLENDMDIEVDEIQIEYEPKIIEVYEPTLRVQPKLLGNEINSTKDELSPVVSPDGSAIFILRQGDSINSGDEGLDDIWFSERNENNQWRKVQPIGKPLNNEGYNFVLSAAKNGKVLYLANTYNVDGTPGVAGISRSEFINGTWELPKKVEIEQYYSNSVYSSYFINEDETIMLLGLQREEGLGSRDLYVSFQKDNGVWSKPLHLGDVINTTGKELSPFLAADTKTLFFSSNGHPGYGSSDLFISKRLDDSWQNWSQPKNLGDGINTENWDAYLSLPNASDELYLVRQNNENGTDIYYAKVGQKDIIDPTLVLYGSIRDSDSKEVLSGKLYISTGLKKGIDSIRSVGGLYKTKLLYASSYYVSALKKGYYAQCDTIHLNSTTGYREVEHDVYLKKIEKGQIYPLNHVQFEQNSAELKTSSDFELLQLLEFLNSYPNAIIRLEGHTEIGDSKYLYQLSFDRVNTVKNRLVDLGVSPKRIKVKSFGGTRPLSYKPEFTEINRRVEFRILKL